MVVVGLRGDRTQDLSPAGSELVRKPAPDPEALNSSRVRLPVVVEQILQERVPLVQQAHQPPPGRVVGLVLLQVLCQLFDSRAQMCYLVLRRTHVLLMTHKVLHTSIVGVVRSPRRAARNVTRTTKKNEVNKNEVNKNEVRREPTGEKVEEKSKYRKAYTLEWVATLARVARVAHAFLAVQVPPLAMHFMVMTLCLLWCVAVAVSLSPGSSQRSRVAFAWPPLGACGDRRGGSG